MKEYFKKYSESRLNRNRSLLVSEFKPQSNDEYKLLEIAKVLDEKDLSFLKSILDRYGYGVIERAWLELREAMAEKRKIRSLKRFFNYLIQEQLKGGDRHD